MHLIALALALVVGAACRTRESAPAPSAGREQRSVATEPSDATTASLDAGRAPHALVVGGTGMLRDVSVELARRGYTTSVIARTEAPLEELVRATNGRVHPIAVDYRETDRMIALLDQAVARHGPIVLVVAWIHSNAPDAPLAIARSVATAGSSVTGPAVDFFHVRGSAGDDPSKERDPDRDRLAGQAGLAYHEVILGFVIEARRSRWLRNAEISAGVIEAIDAGMPTFTVGTTRPWSARP